MRLRDQMEHSGRMFFAWRSYIPLALLGLVAIEFYGFDYLLGEHKAQRVWGLVCLGVAMTGFAVRIVTVGYVPRGTSGRNTKRIKADELNTTGMYSLARHPVYLGNYVVCMGEIMYLHSVYLCVAVTLLFALYYERIMLAEEAYLVEKYGERYGEWAARVPAFFPALFLWQPPQLEFCWRTVLRREHSTLLGIAFIFAALALAGHCVVERSPALDWWWIALLATALGVSAMVTVLKRRTSFLHQPGR